MIFLSFGKHMHAYRSLEFRRHRRLQPRKLSVVVPEIRLARVPALAVGRDGRFHLAHAAARPPHAGRGAALPVWRTDPPATARGFPRPPAVSCSRPSPACLALPPSAGCA